MNKVYNTVWGLFALKRWISSSIKHDTVPKVYKLYYFHVKNPPKRITLWMGNKEWETFTSFRTTTNKNGIFHISVTPCLWDQKKLTETGSEIKNLANSFLL